MPPSPPGQPVATTSSRVFLLQSHPLSASPPALRDPRKQRCICHSTVGCLPRACVSFTVKTRSVLRPRLDLIYAFSTGLTSGRDGHLPPLNTLVSPPRGPALGPGRHRPPLNQVSSSLRPRHGFIFPARPRVLGSAPPSSRARGPLRLPSSRGHPHRPHGPHVPHRTQSLLRPSGCAWPRLPVSTS